MNIGIDIGSTTLKVIVLDDNGDVVYKSYNRHKADIPTVFGQQLDKLVSQYSLSTAKICITGSAGMGVAERLHIPFHQEVIAAIEVTKRCYPDTHTLIDLGGEDAKIVFFAEGKQPDIRMNGSCAGGTGAFIDQMADLISVPIGKLNDEAWNFTKIYPVASRCGVFAKTDVQNLIARNIPLPDLAMSIFQTVANQAITTLIRGHKVMPKVICIGGPLTFIPALRNRFQTLLSLGDDEIILPENSEFFPAWGCAFLAQTSDTEFNLSELRDKLSERNHSTASDTLPPLFRNEEEYIYWKNHKKIVSLATKEIESNSEVNCYLGIDSGSTTTKIVIIDEDNKILFQHYTLNYGNPLKQVHDGLLRFYQEAEQKNAKVRIVGSTSTGYGEDLIKQAFNLDFGIVETIAHLMGAKFIDPKVSFILDIGGQDMKSIFVDNGMITNIELNEACSSGCGSFLQNFASVMNMTLADFVSAACTASNPVDLGTRCTVFMNSKVKQSLRQNAVLDDIAAGLAYSVIKNCLFKVLKISNLNILGDRIVVQGGTFRNDAVFRALELLSEKSVSATDSPELMGAFGAALYAKQQHSATENTNTPSSFGDRFSLKYETKELQCKGCTNQCRMLKFTFENGNICYSGNKCEKYFFNRSAAEHKGVNAFDSKNKLIFSA